MDVRIQLAEGQGDLGQWGSVAQGRSKLPPWTVLGDDSKPIEPIAVYLKDLALCDKSPLTCKSYGHDLLRWWRLLRLLDVAWDQATESDLAVLVGWMRSANNPQRRRTSHAAASPGSVNPRTGKQSLPAGYAPSSINHQLSVLHAFYDFHSHSGRGPVLNPVPATASQRRTLAHRSPMEPQRRFKRGRYRQQISEKQPRSIPDALWDELFDSMRNDRDRALLLFYVSSAARASELLGITNDDVDWGNLQIWVISKGTRLRQSIPADPKAFFYLARYLDDAGLPPAGQPIWQTLRGDQKPLSYWAMRRVLQRANDRLATNWTLHDLRHTAATRMANDPELTLVEVQRILRHAHIDTVSIYTRVRLEDMFDKLQAHYTRPKPEISYPAGYNAEDMAVVFGA